MIKDKYLGNKIVDNITGFIGFAIAKLEHINGCIRYEVMPHVDEKGKFQESQWIDSRQISVLKELKPKVIKKSREGSDNRPPEMNHP